MLSSDRPVMHSRATDTDGPPPSYATVVQEKRTTPSQSSQDLSKTATDEAGISFLGRVCWSLSLLIPFLVALILVYLTTCSSDDWRADLSVVKIAVPDEIFDALLDRTIAQYAHSDTSSSGATLVRRADALQNVGYLSLSMWGWCLRKTDANSTVCSSPSSWFSMTAVLSPSSISPEAFSEPLLHGLILHGLTLFALIVTLVPLALTVWKRYYRNNPKIEPGWSQHILLLVSTILCATAWIIDKALQAGVTTRLNNFHIEAGLGSIFIGVAAMLLAAVFLISSIPACYRCVGRTSRNARHWPDIEKVQNAANVNLEKADRGRKRKKRNDTRGMKRWLPSSERKSRSSK